MKKIIKYIAIILFIGIFCFVTPFIIIPLLHDFNLHKLDNDFNQLLRDNKSSTGISIIGQHKGIEGSTTGNYCTPFTGRLIETELSFTDIIDTYQNTFVAWRNSDSITTNYSTEGIVKVPHDCKTCIPEGVKLLFDKLQVSKSSELSYAVVFQTEYYTSSFDLRCH